MAVGQGRNWGCSAREKKISYFPFTDNVMCLIYQAPRLEHVWESGGIAPPFLTSSVRGEWSDKLERILTMVYVVQSYWACFGLYPSSCMWKINNPTTFRKRCGIFCLPGPVIETSSF
jgi:hypothetical protein